MQIWEAVEAALRRKTGTSVRKFALQSAVAAAGLDNRNVFVEPFKVTTARFPDASFNGT